MREMNKDILVRHKKIDEMTLLELFMPDDEEKKPLVLMYHGYPDNKEFILSRAYKLAINGFFVVVPDIYGFGERKKIHTCSVEESIVRTAKEVNFLIDYFARESLADTSRTGLVGYSMGGCIIFDYLAMEEHRIKAAAPVISAPEWAWADHKFEKTLHFEDTCSMTYEEYMKQLTRKKVGLSCVPILMQNGGLDTLVSISQLQTFYKEMQSLYMDQDDIRLVIYAGIGHDDTMEMGDEIVGWFKKHLK